MLNNKPEMSSTSHFDSKNPVEFEALDHCYKFPQYKTSGSSGADIYAANDEPILISPGRLEIIPTGITSRFPEGIDVQIRSRSGLTFNHQVAVLNSPGTIDSDYRGEWMILLFNHGKEDFIVERGDRIAQMIVSPVIKGWFAVHGTPEVVSTAHITRTGGFGSTGKNDG